VSDPKKDMVVCQFLERSFSEIFPGCKAFRFGSRVSGLAFSVSDLDVFLDTGINNRFLRFEVLTAELLKIKILWDVTLYQWVSSSQCFEGSVLLRNIGNLVCGVSHPKKLESSVIILLQHAQDTSSHVDHAPPFSADVLSFTSKPIRMHDNNFTIANLCKVWNQRSLLSVLRYKFLALDID
jgi:hypothetical protein